MTKKLKRKIPLINFFANLIVVVGLFAAGLYAAYGEPLLLPLLLPISIGLIAICLLIITPGIAYIGYRKYQEKFMWSFTSGIAGILLGILISYANFNITMSALDRKERRIGNPAYQNSNYMSRDSSRYVKYRKYDDALDFSNVNPKKIHSVSFYGYHFTILPDEIIRIDSLQKLFISDDKHINIANVITQLKNPGLLKYLTLKNCGVDSLPANIVKLKNLVTIDISQNPSLDPKQVISVLSKLPKLSWLTANQNQWNDLPSTISNLPHLTQLYLKNNHLTTLPKSLNTMKDLAQLYIYDNPVSKHYDDYISNPKIYVGTDEY